MSTRTTYLIRYPAARNQRAHFGIWVPYSENGAKGTKIHVVGTPMTGFVLEFNRGYDPAASDQRSELISLGPVAIRHVYDYEGIPALDTSPHGDLENTAAEIPAPRASKNIFAAVNDYATNRRCQEWTMDYVRKLVAKQYLDASALEIVQAKRDAPHIGTCLTPVNVSQRASTSEQASSE